MYQQGLEPKSLQINKTSQKFLSPIHSELSDNIAISNYKTINHQHFLFSAKIWYLLINVTNLVDLASGVGLAQLVKRVGLTGNWTQILGSIPWVSHLSYPLIGKGTLNDVCWQIVTSLSPWGKGKGRVYHRGEKPWDIFEIWNWVKPWLGDFHFKFKI